MGVKRPDADSLTHYCWSTSLEVKRVADSCTKTLSIYLIVISTFALAQKCDIFNGNTDTCVATWRLFFRSCSECEKCPLWWYM